MGSSPSDPVDPPNEPRPGLLLLISDGFCLLCGAPKVYAEPTKGLKEAAGLEPSIVCVNAPCPMALLRAVPLRKSLQKVVQCLRRSWTS